MENPSDPSILLRLPMTKAAVKAMDAVTDFVGKRGFGNLKKFMVAGASKVRKNFRFTLFQHNYLSFLF